MSAAATLAGAVPDRTIDWRSIPWKTVYRTVRRLQARIVKAIQAGRWHKVRALVYLLTHSFSNSDEITSVPNRKVAQFSFGTIR